MHACIIACCLKYDNILNFPTLQIFTLYPPVSPILKDCCPHPPSSFFRALIGVSGFATVCS